MVGVAGALLAGAGGGAVVSIMINAVDNFSKTFASAKAKMLGLGVGITAIGIAGGMAVGGLLKMAGEFEQTKIAFTTMLGSAEKAEALLKELADFAARTPFTITGIEANAKQLLAMGIETGDLLPTLKSLGDISAGLNVPLDRLALNFGQVAVQGRLTGRELRDFSVAGVPLIAELAKNLGVTEAVIKDMVSSGDIGFDLVEEAFTSMSSEGGKFFDLMDAQSKTFLGQISNIQDSFIKIGRVMGEVFLPIATKVVEVLGKVVAWIEEHPKFTKFAAIVLGVGTALALVVGPLLIIVGLLPVLIPLIVSGTAMIWGAVAATTAFTLANIWWIAGIVALIAIGYLLIKNWDKVKNAAHNLGVFIGNVFKGIANIVLTVWNFIVQHIENQINKVIWSANKVIKLINKIPGINIGRVADVSLDKYQADLLDMGKFRSLRYGEELKVTDNLRPVNPTVIHIEQINGVDAEDISDALGREMSNVIRL